MYRSSFRARIVGVAIAAALIITSIAAVAAAQPQTLQTPVVAGCRVLIPDLLLRSGPGTAFPVLGRLTQNAVLQGISFIQTGVPNGSWVEVQQAPGRPLGFVSADTRFIACNPLARLLPPGQIPPTPTPAGQRVARTRVNGGDLSDNPIIRGPANVNNGQYIILPGVDQALVDAVIEENGGNIRFGDALGFGVEPLDRRVGSTIGNGIREVQFKIIYFDLDQEREVVAYHAIEREAPYCLFSDRNGQCTVLRFSRMGYKWPDTQWARGALRPRGFTNYTAEITIVPNQGPTILWRWQFDMAQIVVDFP